MVQNKVAVLEMGVSANMAQLRDVIDLLKVDRYYFPKTANKEEELKDLKQFYDIVLEVHAK